MTLRGSARDISRADPPRTRRALGTAGAIAVVMGLGAGLTGCANSAALGLVRQACHHVAISVALYHEAQKQSDPTLAAKERGQAEDQLGQASPLAAIAAGEASQWQALMATLAENSRLPESDLVPALQAQCAGVQSGTTGVPVLPSTTLPPPPS
jgi:hypothetical protein